MLLHSLLILSALLLITSAAVLAIELTWPSSIAVLATSFGADRCRKAQEGEERCHLNNVQECKKESGGSHYIWRPKTRCDECLLCTCLTIHECECKEGSPGTGGRGPQEVLG
ncbi:hypothetical protein BDY17DRAFT_3905 [Neohortaea acidophila]|uniref:Uncharacterized protein n=1 Tax=Neohortaea acidophila TaxID=245834 RepID=A0A6A6Q5A1_9PEZI|nr:uncharacterized protein BDY17DRAFT_3905 [Neohortaea acidophila]KAF2487126.1 hypothetical protein BDY17DRAFT_3905 [Neohortaea acidophila]